MGTYLVYNLTETFFNLSCFIQENLELEYENILAYKENK